MLASGLVFLCKLGLASAATAGQGLDQRQREVPRPVPVAPSTMPALPPAVIDDTLAIGGDDIKGRKLSTRMTVATHVNGRGPYQFVVDSGADSSVVSQRIARDLQLPPGTPAILNATTSSARVERVLVDQLSFGPATSRNLEVPALPEKDLGSDGVIGIDALGQQRLMLDFEQRLVKVEDAHRPARMVDGEIVVVARRRRGQLILTQARVAGVAVEAVIDTGSEVTIGNLALRNRLIRNNRDKFVTVPVTGVTGVTINVELARIGELRLGKVVLRNTPIAFADLPPFKVFGMANKPALLLGTDVLETFRRVSLDFQSRKVRFQLRRCGSTGVVINTAPASLARLSSDGSEVCRR